MDDPEALETSGSASKRCPALSEYYDEIWVYGLSQICDPLAGLSVPAERAPADGLYAVIFAQRGRAAGCA
mgnify:CR=1 FL=1